MKHDSRIHWIGRNKYQAYCSCGWKGQKHEYIEARWGAQFEVWTHETNYGGKENTAITHVTPPPGIDWKLVERGWD